MKFGGNNSPTDVAKLQAFLKDSQGLNVTVNGTFDLQTENAVSAFQTKYLSEIMGPWGATQSSGYVYITTLKKINEIACNSTLTLNLSELDIINAYKNQNNQNGSAVGTSTNPNATTTPLIPLIGQNSTGAAALTAAVGSFAGAWNNFWGSIWKGITKIF
jgi:peptidoglycan hydrolase-like protein with peptidoglycan-binding domain